MSIELGKPADYGQYILQRRYELAVKHAGEAMSSGGLYLDVGCGNGAQTVLFAKHFTTWIGIDVEEARLQEFRNELARTEYEAGNIPHEIEIYNGDAIPLANGTVDFLSCIEVIEHTTNDSATIAELFRVLKPGGTAFITVPNKWWVFETHGANLPLLPWNRVPFFSWLPKPIHSKFAKARIYRRKEIVGLLEAAGFETRATAFVTAPMDMIKNEKLQRKVRNMLFRENSTTVPMLATSVMIVATKPIH
ncbi:MAG: class I SAM-dependent methyltransferase [Candidatus Kapaibacterium sp.]|jgi:ubiquinone/menaquinone biosynthesis C-methylase UbiE